MRRNRQPVTVYTLLYPTVLLLLAVGFVIAGLHRRLRSQRAAFLLAQKLLEENREQLQLALDGANEALWDWKVKENQTYYSDQWSRMLGYSPEEIGRSVDIWEQLVHPEDVQDTSRKLQAHLEGVTDNYQAEFRMRTREGGWRWIQARGKVVARAADGSPARVAGTHLDVTEYKEITEALAKARDAALAASRAKSSFLANMSHEIRTPMNGIIGTSELLLESAQDERQRELAEIILFSSTALLTILNDILDFSKIEAGKLQMERAPFDLHAAVRQSLNLFSPAAGRKKLSLTAEIDPTVPCWIWGDSGRLRQILLNLIGNALKFTEQGGVAVRCRRVASSENSLQVEFEINDTGPGMGSEVLDLLFQPFQQADGSITRRHGGTGLGLAISKHLAELMHGSITVSSVAGEGSTFRLTLDVSEAPAATPVAPRRTSGKPSTLVSARILLAEDNPVNQKVAALMLQRLGHSVDIVSNGREAIEAAGREHYDAILMDCQMPQVSGYEATRQIRCSAGAGPRPPIIALTANSMSADREACLEAGMDDYVRKPVTLEALANVLDKWMVSSSVSLVNR
jgi:PAS domain S-box-containing protein